MKYARTQLQLFSLQMCVQIPRQTDCFPSISAILSGKDPRWKDIPERKKWQREKTFFQHYLLCILLFQLSQYFKVLILSRQRQAMCVMQHLQCHSKLSQQSPCVSRLNSLHKILQQLTMIFNNWKSLLIAAGLLLMWY